MVFSKKTTKNNSFQIAIKDIEEKSILKFLEVGGVWESQTDNGLGHSLVKLFNFDVICIISNGSKPTELFQQVCPIF